MDGNDKTIPTLNFNNSPLLTKYFEAASSQPQPAADLRPDLFLFKITGLHRSSATRKVFCCLSSSSAGVDSPSILTARVTPVPDVWPHPGV